MKKVLLLGDSIRIGYQHYVKDLLADEYKVVFTEDNGRFAAYTLWQANQMLKSGDIALVHFNNGYWDMNIEAPMTDPDIFKAIIKKLDFIIMDIKLADSAMHKKYTGVDNELILKNFEILKNSDKPYIIRTPLIPDITDKEENLTAIK